MSFALLVIFLAPAAIYDPAIAKFQAGDIDGALTEIARVEKQHPKDGVAVYYRGVFLEKKGKVPEAAKAYEQAIRLKPDLAEAHGNLCAIEYKKRALERAATLCKKATQLSPQYVEGFYNLGLVLGEQG